ncbi:TonB-dependent receptor domain-containing protein [Psychrobacter sanguinis]|uniref:TonB-dependent receptor n=1 Tax=Psychrobacter sanguinis TaxID=861445 RepID=A0A844M2K1_9GAMM|nr:TonB-dependent receptor [Psychrobacter sanguinis]MUG33171.1 TonB-dependent receptor [Psychrobacter sanguinis]
MRTSSSNRLSPLCLAVASALVAQVASAQIDTPHMTAQTITVTANSSARDRAQNDSIYTEDYTPAQQASHLSNFLEVVPGVSVGGTNTINQRVRIRGLDDTNLKVTIDGARQEGYMFHHAGDLVIDPDLLKQAEVAVGNNSVTLGNHAIGGAVAFETVDAADLLKPGQKIGAKINTGYGSNNDEVLTSATVFAAPAENVDLLAYYGKRSANTGEDGDGRKIQSGDTDAESILLKAGAYIGTDHHVSGSFSRTENDGDYPNRADFPLGAIIRGEPNVAVPWEQTRDTYTLDYKFNPENDLIDVKANIYQTESEINKNKGDLDIKVKTKGGKVENISRLQGQSGSHTLIAGVEHYVKESDLTRKNSNGSNEGSDEAKNTSVYLEDQWNMGKLTLTPGVRYDHYKSPEQVGGGKTFDNVVGALAANYQLTPSTNFFASYTQIFNGPDLQEVVRNSTGKDKYISSKLEAETGDNAEVGISTTLTNLTTANDSLLLSAKYFVTNIEDLITFKSGVDCTTGQITGSGACSGSFNEDEDYKIKGVELAADYKTNNFGMGLSYSRARSKGDKTGNTIPRDTGDGGDAGDMYMVNLGYAPTEALDLGWRSTYVDSIKSNNTEKPSYDVHDVYLTYKPQQIKGITTTLGVYNIFDETYASHSSRHMSETADNQPGRNIKASLTYQF